MIVLKCPTCRQVVDNPAPLIPRSGDLGVCLKCMTMYLYLSGELHRPTADEADKIVRSGQGLELAESVFRAVLRLSIAEPPVPTHELGGEG